MNSLIRRVGLLRVQGQQQLLVQHYYQRGNINVYKRRPKVKTLHYKKAELMSVLKLKFTDPDEGKPMWETCENLKKIEEPPLTQYEHVLKENLWGKVEKAKFVAVLAANPISAIEEKRCGVYLGRQNMYIHRSTKRVLRACFTDTKYENLLPLFDGSSALLLAAEPTFKEMLSILKKYPQFVLLAGYYDGRLLSSAHIEQCAKLPSLDIARAQLVSTLNSASMQLVSVLGTGQSVLVSHLESRAEELKKGQNPELKSDTVSSS